jgi:hypothetical protein
MLEERVQHCLPSLVRLWIIIPILDNFLILSISFSSPVRMWYWLGVKVMLVSRAHNNPIDLLQRRIGMTSNLEWIMKLISMPFLSLRMHK